MVSCFPRRSRVLSRSIGADSQSNGLPIALSCCPRTKIKDLPRRRNGPSRVMCCPRTAAAARATALNPRIELRVFAPI